MDILSLVEKKGQEFIQTHPVSKDIKIGLKGSIYSYGLTTDLGNCYFISINQSILNAKELSQIILHEYCHAIQMDLEFPNIVSSINDCCGQAIL